MDAERAKRYEDKLEYLRESLNDARDWRSGFEFEEFERDRKTKKAVYKSMQDAVDASMDICAMMLKDSKLTVKDDYTNLEKLHKEELITYGIKEVLQEANGLRNRLVHAYNTLDDSIAFKSIKELIPKIEGFTGEVEKWLKRSL